MDFSKMYLIRRIEHFFLQEASLMLNPCLVSFE